MTPSFESFAAEHRAAGFDEVLERRWPPDTVIDTHTHAERYGAEGATYWVARRNPKKAH